MHLIDAGLLFKFYISVLLTKTVIIMKKAFLTILTTLSVVGLIFVFNTSDISAQPNPGGVEVIKNQNWTISGGCASGTVAVRSTQVKKDGQVHLLTIFFDFSGTCLVPEKGVASYPVGTPYGPADMQVTPSGVGKLQIVVKP